MSKDITAKLKRLTAICTWMADPKRTHLTAQALAKKYGVSQRSILRDLALLREVGLELEQYCYVGYIPPSGFSFEKLGLTPQTAAALCLTYEATKHAGSAFAPTCQYVRRLFSPDKEPYEINPELPKDPVISKLQRAIKEKRYIKIVWDNSDIYAKPYCLVRSRGSVYLVFTAPRHKKSALGAAVNYKDVRWITNVTFETKSRRTKNGRFSSFGAPKREINDFIKRYF